MTRDRAAAVRASVWRAAGTLDTAPGRAGAALREARRRGAVVGGRAEIGVARARRRLQPGHARLAPGRRDRVDAARHRRQRAVPGLPRRLRPRQGHAAGVPRGAARPLRQPLGELDLRGGRRPGGRAAVPAAGPVRSTQPAACRCPAATTRRSGARATGCPTASQAQMTLDAERPGLEGDRHPAGRRLRVQGRDQRVVGRELRRRRRPQRLEHPAGGARRRRGDLLLRPRGRTGSRPMPATRSSPPAAASSPSSAARATGRRTACAAWLKDPDGDGTYTFATAAIPPAATRRRSRTACRGTENYGAGGIRDGANIGFDVPAAGVEVVIFSYDSPPTC